MSANRYPRLAWSRAYKGNPKCWKNAKCACGQPATHKVEVQISPFRGDDKHEARCNAHALAVSVSSSGKDDA